MDALAPAAHVRNYRERVEVVEYAMELLSRELRKLTDEDEIMEVLKQKVKEYVEVHHPRHH